MPPYEQPQSLTNIPRKAKIDENEGFKKSVRWKDEQQDPKAEDSSSEETEDGSSEDEEAERPTTIHFSHTATQEPQAKVHVHWCLSRSTLSSLLERTQILGSKYCECM